MFSLRWHWCDGGFAVVWAGLMIPMIARIVRGFSLLWSDDRGVLPALYIGVSRGYRKALSVLLVALRCQCFRLIATMLCKGCHSLGVFRCAWMAWWICRSRGGLPPRRIGPPPRPPHVARAVRRSAIAPADAAEGACRSYGGTLRRFMSCYMGLVARWCGVGTGMGPQSASWRPVSVRGPRKRAVWAGCARAVAFRRRGHGASDSVDAGRDVPSAYRLVAFVGKAGAWAPAPARCVVAAEYQWGGVLF